MTREISDDISQLLSHGPTHILITIVVGSYNRVGW